MSDEPKTECMKDASITVFVKLDFDTAMKDVLTVSQLLDYMESNPDAQLVLHTRRVWYR